MHPRTARTVWTAARAEQAAAVLAFVRARGSAHPREVDAHFAHGKVKNWFGGSSNASTELLDVMHYRGLLRVARREGGTRVYAARSPAAESAAEDPQDLAVANSRMDALVDLIVRKYAPLPAVTLGQLVSHLRGGAPQWTAHRAAALARAKQRLGHVRTDGIDWYWPADDRPASTRWRPDEEVRLLTPFDPIVWDRRRFEMFWISRTAEAYTAPSASSVITLPLLWHERVIGWGNAVATRAGWLFVRLHRRTPTAQCRVSRRSRRRTGADARISRPTGLTAGGLGKAVVNPGGDLVGTHARRSNICG